MVDPLKRHLSALNAPDYQEDEFHSPPEKRPRPRLAQLWTDELVQLGILEPGRPLEQAAPDLILRPDDFTPEVISELVGLNVAIPTIDRWGTFDAYRTGDDGPVVTLDGDEIVLPPLATIHLEDTEWATIEAPENLDDPALTSRVATPAPGGPGDRGVPGALGGPEQAEIQVDVVESTVEEDPEATRLPGGQALRPSDGEKLR